MDLHPGVCAGTFLQRLHGQLRVGKTLIGKNDHTGSTGFQIPQLVLPTQTEPKSACAVQDPRDFGVEAYFQGSQHATPFRGPTRGWRTDHTSDLRDHLRQQVALFKAELPPLHMPSTKAIHRRHPPSSKLSPTTFNGLPNQDQYPEHVFESHMAIPVSDLNMQKINDRLSAQLSRAIRRWHKDNKMPVPDPESLEPFISHTIYQAKQSGSRAVDSSTEK